MTTTKGSTTPPIKIFSGISEKDLVGLYNSFFSKRLKANEILIKEGSPINCLFVVMSGHLQAQKELDSHIYPLSYLDKGDVYGSLTLYKDNLSPVTLVAVEPTTALCIDEKSLLLVKPEIKIRLLINISSAITRSNLNFYNEILSLRQKITSICQSQLRDYEDLRGLISNSNEFIERLKKIPSLPPYSYELSRMLLQEKISTDKITEYIKTDPSLMAIVLKTVNSPYYNLSQKVSDFHHALLLLGFNQIYQIVMDNSLNNVIPNRPDFIAIKDEAMMTANIAFEIALMCGFEKPIILSTIGMLHVIGRAVKLLLKADENFTGYIHLYDDAIISAIMLKDWRLPEMIYTAISYYKYPEFTPPTNIPQSVLPIVSIIHISKHCLDKLMNTQVTKTPFIEQYLKVVGLNMPVDEIIYKNLLPSMRKKKDMLPRILKEFLAERET